MTLADRFLALISDENMKETIPTTFCNTLDELKETVYLRASDQIDDDQLFDNLCYTTAVSVMLLACMGYDLETVKSKCTNRMKIMDEAINKQ